MNKLHLASVNKTDMKTLIQDFTKQLKDALVIGNSAKLQKRNLSFNNILITGMGGSGIGGTIISELASDIKIPIAVNKTYDLPSWVNEKTLVIGSTYSGNTEETIAVVEAALVAGAELAFITSGGRAGEIAAEHDLNQIVLEGGNPPRSMLSYSLVSLMFLFNHYELTSFDIDTEINNAISLLDKEEANTVADSKKLAESLQNTFPLIYGVAGYEGIATRLRQQINENSKMLCGHHIIPEMNHNELVGWAGADKYISVVILRNADDSVKNQQRIEINKTIISKLSDKVYEVWGKGDSKIARTLYHIHFGDWITMHLSELNGVDVVEVNVIDFLKSELAK
jgi:glucose/mannose-6-phosphate isomerase